MKKTFDQLIVEGKRKRAERLRQVREKITFNTTSVTLSVILPDGTMTPYHPLTKWMHKLSEETAHPFLIVKKSPDDNVD